MATVIRTAAAVACCSLPTSSSHPTAAPPPPPPPRTHHPQHSILPFITAKIHSNPALRNLAFLASNALLAFPTLAEDVEEKGKIFDFNLTLPIIAAEFLLLMVALDNIWFKPVSKVMDDRDEAIRQKLVGVRDNSDEIRQLQEEAEAIIKAARAETTAELNKMKRETAAQLDEKLQESRERIEKELAAALANLEVQKQETLKSLDKQVQMLSDQIIQKVIPFKI